MANDVSVRLAESQGRRLKELEKVRSRSAVGTQCNIVVVTLKEEVAEVLSG